MVNRQPLIAGNWKLNGSRSSVVALAKAVAAGVTSPVVEVLICPTSVHLADVLGVVGNSPVHLGAQNCSDAISGAFTGEVSAEMLVEFGCEYVILGHSERRAMFHEDSALVAAKCLTVQKAGLTPILCVGETLEQREAGQVEEVIAGQLDALLDAGGVDSFRQLVVAYEPVWAIGTGKTASPEEAQAVHALIRERISSHDAAIGEALRVLYGGSVKADNAASLFSQADIDGGLIGGAALDAASFLAICEAAASTVGSSAA
ncbi:triose-phosphate isomerase [Granulosicoccus antarcticus]|uniref:Triosephosphate isomerase n=1 Tax=Granulosicoccus antarcticus IMCC3135 TaxID=1192854 RepID=A0A2Z2NLG7_9GAMM|nr:triose-phosphate isomerase [Granulosicoccus antarcticus]ASJ72302.1 Triosephosphate isomerase [Granulosicoccus antarcticus IMCC3135]